MPNDSLATRVAGHPLWYHAMTLAPGVETPGWFDLRPVVDRLPWPDLAGRRCLDIGTWDGFLAFELERRGAREVVATDLAPDETWDVLPRVPPGAVDAFGENAEAKRAGFEIAAEALGSKVRREWLNVYDLSPERLGTFDVVVCGALLLHLRAPFVALDAIRSVCTGEFLSAEQIAPGLTALSRRRPLLALDGNEGRWTVPNAAGHRRMLEMAGFDIVRAGKPYLVPFGPGHPPVRARPIPRALRRLVGGAGPDGVAYAAVLSRPAV